MVDYVVEALAGVSLSCDQTLQTMDWMSPLGPDDPTGIIWRGQSRDGLNFVMDLRPSIEAGPEPIDGGGVEDPTVHVTSDGIMVFYTGVEVGRGQGALLAASGPDAERPSKRAVLLQALDGQGNIKEATLA